MSVTTISFGNVDAGEGDGNESGDGSARSNGTGNAYSTSRIRGMQKDQLREAAIALLLAGR
jgi:hypothetical protein